MVLRIVRVICPSGVCFFFCSSTKRDSIPRSLSSGITPKWRISCYSIPVLGLWLVPNQHSCVTVVEESHFEMHFKDRKRSLDLYLKGRSKTLGMHFLILNPEVSIPWWHGMAASFGLSTVAFPRFFTNSKVCVYRLLVVHISPLGKE